MSKWLPFVFLSIAAWGFYVPLLHLATKYLQSPLRAFLMVCFAYFLTGVVTLVVMYMQGVSPLVYDPKGTPLAVGAGVLGAVGALGIILAVMNGGKPWEVAPTVFCGAPIVATFVGMWMHMPKNWPGWQFYAGLLMAALGTAITMANKPQ